MQRELDALKMVVEWAFAKMEADLGTTSRVQKSDIQTAKSEILEAIGRLIERGKQE